MLERLTYRSVTVRPVLVPLRRPIVSKVGLFDEWPIILIDLETEEGIVGRSYLEPYLRHAASYIVPAITDLVKARKGKPIRPFDDFNQGQKALNLIGYEGVSMIATAGLDMAAWDALAKAANMPLARLLGGSIGPVKGYNSNGLWLSDIGGLADEARALVAEGGFVGLKLRLGRERLADDLRTIDVVRSAIGPDVKLMVDFNQGLTLGDALHRCHALDDQDLYWFEEPITYTNLAGYAQLARELATPVQLGENFYGPRAMHQALAVRAGDYVMPDLAHRWCHGMAKGGSDGRWSGRRDVDPSLSGVLGSPHARHETAHWLEGRIGRSGTGGAVRGRRRAIKVPNCLGAGIEWNEDAVKQY